MGAVEARRKEKEAASFAKQVAASRARDKAREKAHTQDVLRQWRQRRGADTSGRGDDDAALDALLASKPGAGGATNSSSVSGHKRPRSASATKDRKFGFGGQKRFKKDNSAASSNSLRGFNPARNKALPPGVKPKWGGGGSGGAGGGSAGGGRFGKGGKRMGKQARSAHRGKGRA